MQPTTTAEPALTVADAGVRMGGRTLWSGMTVSVQAGEFAAVLGPNGAGKSTLIMALLGLQPVTGTIRVLGGPPGQAAERVGYLPQRRTFDASMRIRGVDVVRLGLDGHRWGVPTPFDRLRAGHRAAAERIADVIELVGASEYARRPIGELSGGEQQRLLIAQALVRRPELLLLDEPLDSLDLPNQTAIAALISRICTEERVGVIMVAHDVNPILGYLDQVVYLARGRAAAGTPEQVITSETLSALYGTPIEVLRTSSGRLLVVGSPEAPSIHADRHPAPAESGTAADTALTTGSGRATD